MAFPTGLVTDVCSIATTSMKATDPFFFILSAFGFKMAAEDQTNCYTIMSHPRLDVDNLARPDDDDAGGKQVSSANEKDFILWKASSC